MDSDRIRRIVEAALLASDGPLTIASLTHLFLPGELDEEHASKQIREALKALEQEAEHRGVELKRVASGYRYQVRQDRGVSVSQNIMRTLLERDWIRVVGQKEVPGRPSLYGTTKAFLDYFNLKSLDELPPLPEIRALIEPALIEDEFAEAPQEQSAEPSVNKMTRSRAVPRLCSCTNNRRAESRFSQYNAN